jgi:hypothetical protein
MKRLMFTFDLLEKHVNEKGLVLLKDYSGDKLTRESVIEGICVNENCDKSFSKGFRTLVDHGWYCADCMVVVKIQKKENTCLDKYGKKNPLQVEEIQNRMKETNKKNMAVNMFFKIKQFKKIIKRFV